MTQEMGDEKGLNQPEDAREPRTAKAFGENHRLLEELVETAGNLIVLTDTDGRIVLFNRACEDLTGYRREEVFGKTIPELFLPPEWVPVVQKRFADPYAPEVRAPHENPWRTKSGEERIIEWRCTVIPSPEDGRPCILGTGTDITERKKSEEKVRQERDRVQAYLDVAGVMMVAIDGEGRVTLLNRKGCEVLGCSAEEVVDKNWLDTFVPERIRDQVKPVLAGLMAGETEAFEYFENPVLTKKGEERIIAWHNTVLRDRSGNITVILSSGEDITERKRAQEALRESEERYRDLAESITDLFFAMDRNLRYTYWNKASENFTGISAKDAVGKTIHEVFPYTEETKRAAALYQEVLKTGRPKSLVNEYPYAGKTHFFELSASPTRDGISVHAKDITERKRMEEEIRNLAQFPTENPNPVLRLDRHGAVLSANEASKPLLRDWDSGIEQVAPKSWRDMVTDVLSTRQSRNVDVEFAGKSYTFLVKPVMEAGYVNLYGRDITERKRAEEALRESEQRYRTLFESSVDAILLTAPDGRVFAANPEACRIFQRTEDEIRQVGRNGVVDLTDPRLQAALQERARTGRFKGELTLKRKDGTTFPGEISTFIFRDSDGAERTSMVIRDVTERKRMEEELKRYSTNLERLVFERTGKLAESEKKYRSLVENIPDVAWTTDSDGRTMFVSPNVTKVVGRTPEEIYAAGGTLWLERMHPDDVGRVREAYEGLFVRNEPYDVEYRIQRKDGEWIWLHDRSVATYEKDGRQYADGLLSDITEHKRIERQIADALLMLAESEAKFRGLYESVRDGIMANDLSGRIYDCNRALENMVGYSLDELRKMRYQDITPEQYRALEDRIIREEMVKGRFSGYVEKEYIRKDGTRVPVEVAASVVKGTAGRPDMIWAVIRDITERKRMQEALVRSQRLATIGEVAAMIGHDLRNPLTGIVGATYYLKTKLGSRFKDRKAKEMLHLIEQDIERSDKIINDLLEYSKGIDLQLAETDVKSIARDAVAQVKIPRKIRVVDSTKKKPKVMLDVDKMRRVFVNLVRNAVDAMPKGGTLRITSGKSDDRLKISFADTGTGMTRETVGRLWTPLHTTKAKGIGLGLPIARRFVEAHGGSVSVETKEGSGSVFTVTVPIKSSAERKQMRREK